MSTPNLTKLSAEELAKFSQATFAGGCFWCMEPPFEKLEGVMEVTPGYTGGTKENPTYEEVSSGFSGHVEAIQVFYDPEKISYEELLETFWQNVDPTDDGGQFVDRGMQYKTAIFYHDETQKIAAEKSKKELEASGRYKKPIVTEISAFTKFYPAEEYHQDYYKKNPFRYKWYRQGSGRDQYLDEVWGESRGKLKVDQPEADPPLAGSKKYVRPADEEIQKMLTPLQYKVTQKEGTEPPFENEYAENKAEGIYVDIVSGEPLFSSLDKYDSGTGWPSFSKPLEADNIVTREDRKLFSTRTEVRSKYGDSHLGHVFPDGPAPTGTRYCMNSAALKFIPKEELEEKGYGEYLNLFE